MAIFILEDDVMQAQQLKKQLQETCTRYAIDDTIYTTSRPQELISWIPTSSPYALYFLDIEIKGDNRQGLKTAQQIRTLDPTGMIVFITTHAELAPISYEYMVSAFTYIVKQAPLEKRLQQITACIEQYAKNNANPAIPDDFIVDTAWTTVRLPFSTLQYIMTAEPHRLEAITTQQVVQFYGTLKEVEGIDTRLFRCHQSYVVYVPNIRAIDYKARIIHMQAGVDIPFSRRNLRKLKTLIQR